jgi:UDP-2,4-diacetamido-2,4,6-trideoxy-beta-L-altropyranose hydrolase
LTSLLIRADAGEQMGTGHVMRTLALAQAWQDTGEAALFATAAPPPGIVALLHGESVEVAVLSAMPGSDDDARQIIALAGQRNATRVVVDGYQFNGNYQRRIKESGLRLLVLDDCGHADHYWADWVLNQNLHAEENSYRNREPYTRLLLGVRFALLRREFGKWQGWQRTIPDVANKVLVTLGGSDPDNATLRIVEALGQTGVPDLEAVVLAGAANRHCDELRAAAQGSPAKVRLEAHVSDMPSLMAWADLGVGAAGSTSWERAFMGLPSLTVVLADNQSDIARALQEAGIARNLGWHADLRSETIARNIVEILADPQQRTAMATRGKDSVIGDGAARVVRILAEG